MNIISHIMKKIWHILAFIIIFLTILIATLKHGINVEKIDLGEFKAEQLYIKLDKKLILRARNIEIPKTSKEDSSNDSLLRVTDNIGWIDMLFKEVLLERIKLDNNEFTILFFENAFHIDTAYLTLDTTFTPQPNGLNIDVYWLAFKDFNVNLTGNANADIKNNIYDFNGTFSSHELNGKANIKLEDEMLNYTISDINASSLKGFMDELGAKLELNKDVKNWIYGYVTADNYFVQDLSGKFDLKTENFYLKELKANGVSKNVKAKFDSKLPPATVEEVKVELKNETLKFSLKNPKWQGKNLNGTSLEIYKIFDEKGAGLLLDLKASAAFDKQVNSILKAYHIDIPIEQKSGKAEGRLKLDLNFDKLDMKIDGKFNAKDSVIDIAGAKFNVKNADINISNDKVLVNAADSGIDFFNADIKVDVDIAKQNADISGNVKKFDLNIDGNEIAKFGNLPLSAKLDFSKKDVTLDIENPKVNLVFGNENKITINNLKDVINHSPLLKDIGIKDGNFTLVTKDFENIDLSLKDAKFSLPLVEKDGSDYDSDSFDIKISKNIISGKSDTDRLKFRVKDGKTFVDIKDLDFELKSDDGNQSKDINIEFSGIKSSIMIYDINRTMDFLSYNGSVDKDSLKLEAKPSSGTLSLSKTADKFDMSANDISGEFVNSLIGKNSFEKGNFKLRILGTSTDDFKGEVRLHGANLSDYTFYNRLLTFLNSVPSLIIFKTPDFTEKGFPIKFGKILFQKKGNLIEFVAIDLESSSADIAGRGTIDLATKNIDIDLELKLLKDASSIIGSIPIVNQIILGKDRSISTVIKVRGTLDDPKYSTQVLADTLMSPFNIIKNVLEAPFLIFE
ncbi:AsmA-like C-terminal domain-containing protein [Campylobacter sp. RM15925]|uniref:YhdP family protein n=1 Tax=Campylobacter sp. RM15925 TaxID=1705724 RepID=UPI001475877C|nr:AsmA-like C-terminal domain-containing protein [Campylobacter sp. RM15925]